MIPEEEKLLTAFIPNLIFWNNMFQYMFSPDMKILLKIPISNEEKRNWKSRNAST